MPSKMKTLSAKSGIVQKQQIKEIQDKVHKFCNDKKNSNNLIDIISEFQTDDKDVQLFIIKSVHKIFVQLIGNQDMFLAKMPSGDQELEGLTKSDRYKLWLRERYEDVKGRLGELLTSDNPNVQELALCTLLKFVQAEGQTPLREITGNHLYFPAAVFEPLLLCLLSAENDLCPLIARFQEYLEYDDIRYYSLKVAVQNIKHRSLQLDVTDVYLNNLLALLENISMPLAPPADGQTLNNFISKLPEITENLKITSYKEHKKLFTTLWLDFLKQKLPTSSYKRVLVSLHEKVMPHMTSPLLLSDFLTESYNIGGAISLLALNGLFILINSHNLNYPHFYEKLYALFEPNIFHVKYRARFFFLADLFLTSTHLPSYLVAAFAKKLCRLALTAPPSGLVIILPFVHNLLTRHPSCQVLIHRPDVANLDSDPFVMEEKDLSKCKALESSLWEIKTLQSHFHHTISTEANKFDHKLKEQEIDLGPLLEISVDDLLEKEFKKKIKEVPVTFTEPKSLFEQTSTDDIMPELWTS